MYNFVDLFAGCGGLSEGFLQTKKFNGIAHVEWEIPMVETLRHRLVQKWSHSSDEAIKRVVHFDIQNVEQLITGNWSDESKEKYANTNDELVINKGLKGIIGDNKIDVIIGGPPCQAYSIHGRATDKNSMADDYRNFLFESFVEVVHFCKPKLFVFENVPGILSAKPGGVRITDRIFEAFDKIGYNILDPSRLNEAVFDTSNFKVPQKRKRVILVGIPKESKLNLDVLYNHIRSKQTPNQKVTVKEAIGNFPKILPIKGSIRENKKNISHEIVESPFSQHFARYHNNRDVEIFKEWVNKNMNKTPHIEKIQYYYNKTGKKTLYSKYKNLEWDKQSHTIVAHLEKDGLMFIHPDSEQARSITIREAASLMTFPNDYVFLGSNAKCFKMIGNAVPVNFAKLIAEAIIEVLNKN